MVHNFFDSEGRGQSGLPPRPGENMWGYYAGQRTALENNGGTSGGGAAVILLGGGLVFVVYLLVTGPLLNIALSGIAATFAVTAVLRYWKGSGVTAPMHRLLFSVALAYVAGFLAMLLLLGAGTLLRNLAGLSLLSYVGEIETDQFGSTLGAPALMVFDPSLPAYWLNFVVGWAATVWIADRRLAIAAQSRTGSVFKLAGIFGGAFFACLQLYRIFVG